LAVRLTENETRILCYHGGSIEDEHVFNSSVFISLKGFKKHLQLINKYQFKVLPLDDIVNGINQRVLPKRSLALTFDDGFYNTTLLESSLKEAKYPATLYVSTYYVIHQSPVFTMALAYLFYKTPVEAFTITLEGEKEYTFKTKGREAVGRALKILIQFFKTLDEQQQNNLLQHIGSLLKVDVDRIWNKRLFHNVTANELKALYERGVFDIQLHTHRHNLPTNENEFIYEIEKNRQILSEITGKGSSMLCHFCYPSGLWEEKQFTLLKKLEIKSATTLDSGLNSVDENLLSLKRILCHDASPLIILEANLSGFNSILKKAINRLKRLFNNRANE
jgi:peptidoglycan/xylan/chitin deacetylase (PgdA/CDA1 family)